jgi:hypothetical protein
MKLLPLTCAIWLVASCPSWAGEQEERFLELKNDSDSVIFDLNTVQMVQPGRFTVIETEIDNPDVMKLKLKVLAMLRTYCSRADGKYPAPTADVFTLGPPDMPVQNIEVRSAQSNQFKMVSWSYPYERLALSSGQYPAFLHCKQINQTEDHLYAEQRALVLNGLRTKRLYDCKRAVWGQFQHEDDELSKIVTGIVRIRSMAFKYYLSVCRAVTHETPYVPEE